MRIVSKAAITEFVKRHADAAEPLKHWYRVAAKANWQNLTSVRQDFAHADSVDPFTVFNIGGNNYRLIAIIKYRWHMIYIRQILTHAEYDKEKWKS